MSTPTVRRPTSNTSAEQVSEAADPFSIWRSLARTLSQHRAAADVVDATALIPSETTTMSRRDDRTALGNIYEQARLSFGERKLAAIRTAFEVVNERQSSPPPAPSAGITGMEKWEGTVIDVDSDFFSVQLSPLADGSEVTADFPRDLITDDDLQVGDVVYVTVRTVQGIGGPKRTSAVRLRRLGRWTEAEVAAQNARAKAKLSRLESKFA